MLSPSPKIQTPSTAPADVAPLRRRATYGRVPAAHARGRLRRPVRDGRLVGLVIGAHGSGLALLATFGVTVLAVTVAVAALGVVGGWGMLAVAVGVDLVMTTLVVGVTVTLLGDDGGRPDAAGRY